MVVTDAHSPWRSALASPAALLLSLVLPSRCAGCGTPRSDAGGGGFCQACWEVLPCFARGTICPRCALPAAGASCRRCTSEPPPVDGVIAFGPYEGALKRLISALKFEGYDIAAGPAAARLANTVRSNALAEDLDGLTPVPSTRRRNNERGYDPAALLGEEVARRLSLKFLPALHRVRETPPQSALTASERRTNVAGAFRARPSAAGRSLLLVDDVMTTGATAFAAAAALRSAGARRVVVAVLARTPEPDA